VTPCIDGDHAKEGEPRPKDVSGPTAITPGSPRGLGFNLSREVGHLG
jgi:hypothetical protein